MGILAAPAVADPCLDADLLPSPEVLDRVAAATLCLVNAERASAGLAAVEREPSLDLAGVRMAGRMADEHFFEHVTPDGVDVVRRVMATEYLKGFEFEVIGENLGWGTGHLATPAAMVAGWMQSPEHRENILYPQYRHMGVGLAEGTPVDGASDGFFYVTDFGSRTPKPRYALGRLWSRLSGAHRVGQSARRHRHSARRAQERVRTRLNH